MNANGISQAIRTRTGWLIFCFILLMGFGFGWLWTTNNQRCEELVAEHQRLVGMFQIAAEAAASDGDPATAKVFKAYATSTQNTDVPNC